MNGVLKCQKLYKIWMLLENAVKERTPYTFMKLATTTTGTTNFRTVIIRDIDKEHGVISFVTDSRSQKICEINKNPHVTLTAIDYENGQQVQINGCANVIFSYASRQKTGHVLPSYSHPLSITPAEQDMVAAYSDNKHSYHDTEPQPLFPIGYFCLVNIQITQLKWLDFTAEPRTRDIYIKVADEWICGNAALPLR
ncbi:TPA: pyridoxamine 5'-phosphate oxidase family protein [Aeromonas veronii]